MTKRTTTYRDLPLPAAWEDALKPFQVHPGPSPLKTVERDDIGPLVDRCLEVLDEDVVDIVWHRAGLGLSLGEIARLKRSNIARVTRYERRLRTPDVRAAGAAFIDDMLSEVKHNGIVLLHLHDTRSVRFPDATPDQLFQIVRMCLNLEYGSSNNELKAVQAQQNVWLIGPRKELRFDWIDSRMFAHPYLRSVEAVAAATQTTTQTVLAACAEGQYVTLRRNGTVSSNRWTKRDWICAVANALDERVSQDGQTDLHVSQVVRAVPIVNPGMTVSPQTVHHSSTSPEQGADQDFAQRHNLRPGHRPGYLTVDRTVRQTHQERQEHERFTPMF